MRLLDIFLNAVFCIVILILPIVGAAMGWLHPAWIALVPGGFLCVINFWITYLRYPIHRLRGGTREEFNGGVSGIPLFGSLLVAISLVHGWHDPWWLAAGVVLIAIDTGGLHWFIGIMLWEEVLKPKLRKE